MSAITKITEKKGPNRNPGHTFPIWTEWTIEYFDKDKLASSEVVIRTENSTDSDLYVPNFYSAIKNQKQVLNKQQTLELIQNFQVPKQYQGYIARIMSSIFIVSDTEKETK